MAQLFDPTLNNLDSICRTDVTGKPSFTQMLIRFADLVNVSQTLTVSGVPDARQLQVTLTRSDGSLQLCTVANGGITYADQTLHFANTCTRLAADRAVSVNLLCAD
jgi:hypothetical protein